MKNYFSVFILLISAIANAQNDTIRLRNSEVLMGEVKSFSRGIIIIETHYSDKDFRVEFNKVKGISIQRKCIILLTEGRRRFGNIKTDSKGMVKIISIDHTVEYFKIDEIIAFEEVNDKFWNRFNGSIDIGFNFTKANNDSQFTIGGAINYIDEIWLLKGEINVLNSNQENAEKTKRTDASLELIRILKRKWYLFGDVSFLSNTEQALDSRINPNLGAGRFMISTNKLYLGLSLGFAYNIENYVDSSLDKTSTEAFISTSFNMFDYTDVSLTTGLKFFVSLSEKGRVRSDYDITLKYDLPLDFYIKMGYTLNYDNQPAIEGNDFDYIFTSGFGWEFD